jgi:predicted nucleic acid-binding protein
LKYWDSSALLPLLVRESYSDRMAEILADDPAMATWWGASVECVSAIARLERDASLDSRDVREALERLKEAAQTWSEVPPTPTVREQAIRLLRLHRLRAGDALQLAAAIVAADFEPSTLEFVTLDARQAAAAEREGLRVISV